MGWIKVVLCFKEKGFALGSVGRWGSLCFFSGVMEGWGRFL